MATGVRNWSTTPSGNASLTGIPMYEGMQPAQLNDSIRTLMAELAKVAPPWVRPEEFGAVGNGTTDDSAAILAAAATGSCVIGDLNKIYAVSGNIDFSSVAHLELRDLQLKQLTPNSATRKTIYTKSNASVKLHNVSVNRNGTGAFGALSACAGIWIESCEDTTVVACRVTGNDAGAGFVLKDCDGLMVGCRVADIFVGTAAGAEPADDAFQGFVFDGSNMEVTGCRALRLYSRWAAQPSGIHLHTRGFTVQGYERRVYQLTFTGCRATFVDQGFDVTGDEVPENIIFQGCHADHCILAGFKAANTSNNIRYLGCLAYRCAQIGFTASAASGPVGSSATFTSESMNTHDVSYHGCLAKDVGYGKALIPAIRGTTTYGFKVEDNALHPTYPRNVVYHGCVALAYGSDMANGFVNQQTTLAKEHYPRHYNCRSEGATDANFSGFLGDHAFLVPASNLAVPSSGASFTAIPFGTITTDPLGVTTGLIMPFKARYTITFNVCYEYNATGSRIADLTVNGTPVPGTRDSRAAAPDTATFCSMTVTLDLNSGDVVAVRGQQSAGVNINVVASDTSIRITTNLGELEL